MHTGFSVFVCAILAAAALGAPVQSDGESFSGGYILMSKSRNGQVVGLAELQKLAASASSLPVNRVWLSFFSPTMTYVPGSNTLKGVGLGASTTGDYGFAAIKKAITDLQSGGVSVFLSMGGWNDNCWPYMYARYSVAGYGPDTPNYWKVQKYAGGNIDGCTEQNQWCYTCEPQSENTTFADFGIFPEPTHSPTWQQAISYVESGANSTYPPSWDTTIVPGSKWTDNKTGIEVTVPGMSDYVKQQRDPYADVVYLAKDLGAAGIDLDYEEFWHADYFKYGSGPWVLPQTVYKYTAIAKDLMLNIQKIAPSLRLSTAASAVGGWGGNWWGGNLKSVWYIANQMYPDVIKFMSSGNNAGGVNVMSYDLSDDPTYHECPSPGVCSLDEQVAFYLGQYANSSIPANVGYEIGVPAYPSPVHNPSHQLPLTHEMLNNIISQTQPKHKGGFMWSIYKEANSSDNATPTQTAQAICKTVLGAGTARCSGSFPAFGQE